MRWLRCATAVPVARKNHIKQSTISTAICMTCEETDRCKNCTALATIHSTDNMITCTSMENLDEQHRASRRVTAGNYHAGHWAGLGVVPQQTRMQCQCLRSIWIVVVKKLTWVVDEVWSLCWYQSHAGHHQTPWTEHQLHTSTITQYSCLLVTDFSSITHNLNRLNTECVYRRLQLFTGTHPRAMESHLPYKITQCYLHPTQMNTPHHNCSQACWCSIYLRQRHEKPSWPEWFDGYIVT